MFVFCGTDPEQELIDESIVSAELSKTSAAAKGKKRKAKKKAKDRVTSAAAMEQDEESKDEPLEEKFTAYDRVPNLPANTSNIYSILKAVCHYDVLVSRSF